MFTQEELAALQRLLGHPTITYIVTNANLPVAAPADLRAEALAVRAVFRSYSTGAAPERVEELLAALAGAPGQPAPEAPTPTNPTPSPG